MITPMLDLLVQGTKILGTNAVENGDNIDCLDISYPKDVIPDWDIKIGVAVPNGFNYNKWILVDGELEPAPALVIPSDELITLKEVKIKEIKTYRDKRTQEGGYKVGPHWYHSDVFSRTQQLGLVIMGANMPGGIGWKTMDNGIVPMTPSLAGQIFAAAAASDLAIYIAAKNHIDAVSVSTDPANYDFSKNWPVIFGE